MLLNGNILVIIVYDMNSKVDVTRMRYVTVELFS